MCYTHGFLEEVWGNILEGSYVRDVLGSLHIAFMTLFLGINLVNMLKSLVLLGLTWHLKMSFSIKMSPQIQKQDLEVRVNWRGHHHSRVLDFRFTVLSSCDVLATECCWGGFAFDGRIRDLG